jgi:Icc-related predicted phosphoesterase
MRLQIFSDLHADVSGLPKIEVSPDVDAVIVAGDVYEGAERAFQALRLIVPQQIPVVATLGNHEFYGRTMPEEIAHARAVAPLYGVHLLENNAVTLNGVRFVGATLWTDYALFGEGYVSLAMHAAREGLNDHRRITWVKRPWVRFRPQDALKLHRESKAYIEAVLATPFAGPTVVVTHHAPHPRSVHPRFANDLLSAAFASDLSATIEAGRPALWIHGHVHDSFDYHIGDTRILCNPRGYGHENAFFNKALLADLHP